MAATLKVPIIFTAMDKISSVVKKMGRGVGGFGKKMEVGIAKGNRLFNKLTPSIGEAGKQMLSFLSTAAIAASIISGLNFGKDSLIDYEDAIASFRTIVSDLTNKEFANYETAVGNVAKETKISAVEVAKSFENIAGLNADFAKTSEAISIVSKSAIVLAKASRDELGPAAENLVGIMNQFGFEANKADKTINVLAAGQAVGAASITQTAESFKNFGSVASGSNITLEESVALIQTMGKFSVFGAEAGTKLRGSVLKLQKAGIGYASGQFQINDALEEARKKLDKLKTAKQKDLFLNKMFGAENVSTGRILLSNIDTFKNFTEGVTGTSEAQKAAAINSNTLKVKLEQVKASFVNVLTSSDNAKAGLGSAKEVVGFLADNMGQIVAIGLKLIMFFAAWKLALVTAKIALVAYNIALGAYGALTGAASINIGKNAVALAAYKIVLAVVTAATWIATAASTAFAIAMNLGLWPILAIIAAIGAIIAIFVYWDEIVAWFSKMWSKFTNWIGGLWDKLVGWFQKFDFKAFFKGIMDKIIYFLTLPLTFAKFIFSKWGVIIDWFKGRWELMKERLAMVWDKVVHVLKMPLVIGASLFKKWGKLMEWFKGLWFKLIAPIKKLWGGLVGFFQNFEFKKFFMDIGQSIINFLLTPIKSLLGLLAKLPGKAGRMAAEALDKLSEMSTFVKVEEPEEKRVLNSPAVSASNAISENIETQRNTIDLNVNDKGNNVESIEGSGPMYIPIKVSSTQS